MLLSRLADISTACCDFSARALENNDGFSNVLTVPNGVDLANLPARGTLNEQVKYGSRCDSIQIAPMLPA